MISLPVTISRIARGQDRKDADQRYSGVAAGPAERGSGTTTSVAFLADVGTNLQLAREEWAENKAFCAYCQTASALSIASAVLAAPEVIKAVRAVAKK